MTALTPASISHPATFSPATPSAAWKSASGVEDPVLKEKLDSILRLQLSDNVNAREMQPDGSYQKVKPAPGEPLVNSQMGMYDLLRDDWKA